MISNGEYQGRKASSLMESYPMAAAWLWEVMVESHGDLLFEALFNLFLLKYPEKLEETSVGGDLYLYALNPALFS